VTRTEKVIAFSAGVEAVTGLALVAAPVFVAHALLGADLPPVGPVVARCFGVALIALALAVWPDRDRITGAPALRAMLLYNASLPAYLIWLCLRWHLGGILLWPAVVLHAGVAVLLALPLLGVRDEA
jgi:hypothetical protein